MMDDAAIEVLAQAGKGGDLDALARAASVYLARGDVRGVALVEYYRLRTEIRGGFKEMRVNLALAVAVYYRLVGELRHAEQWAVRALLDGPSMTVFALLGSLAEAQGDRRVAEQWHACARAVGAPAQFDTGEVFGFDDR